MPPKRDKPIQSSEEEEESVEEQAEDENQDVEGQADSEETKEGSEDAPKKKKKKSRKQYGDNKPTTEMVLEALVFYNDDKKGTTIPAMKNHILKYQTMRPTYLPNLMRKALTKLQADGLIMRPKGQEENKGIMMGRYKIAPGNFKKDAPRARPESLRRLNSDGQIQKTKPQKKKKKKRRRGFY